MAQQYIQTIKYRNLDLGKNYLDLGNGVKTNAQLTYPAIGKGPFPGILLIQGTGVVEVVAKLEIIAASSLTKAKMEARFDQ